MKHLVARVWVHNDPRFAPGALPAAVSGVPVTVDFDASQVVGRATVFEDGSAEVFIEEPVKRHKIETEFGFSYVVEQYRRDDCGRLVVERLRPISVSVSAALLQQLQNRPSRQDRVIE